MDNQTNISALYDEINWLQGIIEQVIKSYLVQEGHEKSWRDIPLPDLSANESIFAQTVKKYNLNVYERLLLALAAAPSLQPEVLDIFFSKNQVYDRGFTEFGGIKHSAHSGFLPTAQTFCFLVTATDKPLIREVLSTLSKENILIRENIILLEETDPFIPSLSGILGINKNWLHYFITGQQLSV
ncbi:MAG: ftsH4 2 [Chitinophagaceae bacterium]|nr:ftsH4 2 [Chitinophagaceae bacterium]